MTSCFFEVAGRISTDHRPRLSRRGIHKSPSYAKSLQAIRLAAASSRRPGWDPTAPVRIEVFVIRRSWAHAPDLDNILKPILDGCVGVLLEDDRPQIVRSVRASFEIGNSDITHVYVFAADGEQRASSSKKARKKAA